MTKKQSISLIICAVFIGLSTGWMMGLSVNPIASNILTIIVPVFLGIELFYPKKEDGKETFSKKGVFRIIFLTVFIISMTFGSFFSANYRFHKQLDIIDSYVSKIPEEDSSELTNLLEFGLKSDEQIWQNDSIDEARMCEDLKLILSENFDTKGELINRVSNSNDALDFFLEVNTKLDFEIGLTDLIVIMKTFDLCYCDN